MKVKLDNGAFMPERSHPLDAGLDLRAPYSFTIRSGGREDVDTGVHVEIPTGYFGLISSKSGLMVEHGLKNDGIIDSNYRGSIHAVLFNNSKHDVDINVGDKITQLIIVPCEFFDLEQVNELSPTDRGENGFGSTGR